MSNPQRRRLRLRTWLLAGVISALAGLFTLPGAASAAPANDPTDSLTARLNSGPKFSESTDIRFEFKDPHRLGFFITCIGRVGTPRFEGINFPPLGGTRVSGAVVCDWPVPRINFGLGLVECQPFNPYCYVNPNSTVATNAYNTIGAFLTTTVVPCHDGWGVFGFGAAVVYFSDGSSSYDEGSGPVTTLSCP